MTNIEKEIELEQIEKSLYRENIYGIHSYPVKKARKCTGGINKKRHYSKNVTIKMNPNSAEFQEKMRQLKLKIRK